MDEIDESRNKRQKSDSKLNTQQTFIVDANNEDSIESESISSNKGKGVKRKKKALVPYIKKDKSDNKLTDLTETELDNCKFVHSEIAENSNSILLSTNNEINQFQNKEIDSTRFNSNPTNNSIQLENQSDRLTEPIDELSDYYKEFVKKNSDNQNFVYTTQTSDEFEKEFFNNETILRFYWWDAFEDTERYPGIVYLLGKTYSKCERNYVSCCIAVKNIDRKLYFLPKENDITTQAIFNEISETILKQLNIFEFTAKKVTKKYVFDPEIPKQSDYLQVRYSTKFPTIPNSFRGRTYSKIFGSESSGLEIFLLEKKIKGPCWLDITKAIQVTNPSSWCKFEYNCLKMDDINLTSINEILPPPPPLIVAAINMRCILNPTTLNTEICMMSCICHKNYLVDKQPPNPLFQDHFCVMTRIDQYPLPLDLYEIFENYQYTKIQKMDSERALLNYFINQFMKIDPDLIVGHDLQTNQFKILCERLCFLKINNTSKLSRLKQLNFNKTQLENNLFIGRLVCDIKKSVKELIKCRSYDLPNLCKTILNKTNVLELEEIRKMFEFSKDILKLIELTMQDTFYILKIMYELNLIPLALEMTNIVGNLMSKSLMGGWIERNEFLLLHSFHEHDYIVPDRKMSKFRKNSKKSTFTGGLVLEPKIGFYDHYILLMDFNSLYPSIIKEYNICFTTIPLANYYLSEEKMVLPDKNLPLGILPREINKLIQLKSKIKNLEGINNKFQEMQLNIKKMALKLIANCIYGCLGSQNSRFYAKHLASLITYKSREILQNSCNLIKENSYEIIYGDTDSIMINTKIKNYNKVLEIGNEIKNKINKLYKEIELEIDNIFKYVLLLKKKKYAGVILIRNNNSQLITKTEYKGIEIVRKDWSKLSSKIGYYILNEIFKDQTHNERINNIKKYLIEIVKNLKENLIPLNDLLINKTLIKNPNFYFDHKYLPHVHVALRYNEKFNGFYKAGDTVSYIICNDSTNRTITERAYHLEEFKSMKHLKIDNNYYLYQQIFPVISRICEPINGLNKNQICEWLGIDTNLTKNSIETNLNLLNENFSKLTINKFRNVEKFRFKCSACKCFNQINNNRIVLNKCSNFECKIRPIDYLPKIQHQLIFIIRNFIEKYYLFELKCEKLTCSYETRRLPLNFNKNSPICPKCQNSIMLKKYTEYDLEMQLIYFHQIFDLSKNNNFGKESLNTEIENGLNCLRETVENYLKFCPSSTNLTELFSDFWTKSSKD